MGFFSKKQKIKDIPDTRTEELIKKMDSVASRLEESADKFDQLIDLFYEKVDSTK